MEVYQGHTKAEILANDAYTAGFYDGEHLSPDSGYQDYPDLYAEYLQGYEDGQPDALLRKGGNRVL